MRRRYDNDFDNSLDRMFTVNKNYGDLERVRFYSREEKSLQNMRNGMWGMGANQLSNFVEDDGYAIVGFSTSSTVVR